MYSCWYSLGHSLPSLLRLQTAIFAYAQIAVCSDPHSFFYRATLHAAIHQLGLLVGIISSQLQDFTFVFIKPQAFIILTSCYTTVLLAHSSSLLKSLCVVAHLLPAYLPLFSVWCHPQTWCVHLIPSFRSFIIVLNNIDPHINPQGMSFVAGCQSSFQPLISHHALSLEF